MLRDSARCIALGIGPNLVTALLLGEPQLVFNPAVKKENLHWHYGLYTGIPESESCDLDR
jgi:hypothetical protein